MGHHGGTWKATYFLRWCLQSFHYFLQVFPCLSPKCSLSLYQINLRNKPKNIQIWPSENNTDLVANMARIEEKVAASSFKALSSFRSFIMVSVTMDFSVSYLLFKLARAPSAVWVNTCRDHDLLFYVHFQANESCTMQICWNESAKSHLFVSLEHDSEGCYLFSLSAQQRLELQDFLHAARLILVQKRGQFPCCSSLSGQLQSPVNSPLEVFHLG